MKEEREKEEAEEEKKEEEEVETPPKKQIVTDTVSKRTNLFQESDSDDDSDSVDELPKPKPRAQRVQRKSISAEAFGQWNRKEDFVPPVVPKTDEQKERIRAKLTSFMFKDLEPKELDVVVDAMSEFKASPGDKVIVEGTEGDCLYVVEQGELDCTKLFPGATEITKFLTYMPGMAFGELALLYNALRAASITANTDCILWKLD